MTDTPHKVGVDSADTSSSQRMRPSWTTEVSLVLLILTSAHCMLRSSLQPHAVAESQPEPTWFFSRWVDPTQQDRIHSGERQNHLQKHSYTAWNSHGSGKCSLGIGRPCFSSASRFTGAVRSCLPALWGAGANVDHHGRHAT